jgi:hypothetical protein
LKPFASINSLFKPYSANLKKTPVIKRKAEDRYHLEAEKKEVEGKAIPAMFTVMHHFKKHHGMLNW